MKQIIIIFLLLSSSFFAQKINIIAGKDSSENNQFIRTNDSGYVLTTVLDEEGDKITVNSSGQLHVVLMGQVDSNNSTSTLLLADSIFTGVSSNILDYGFIYVTVFSDVESDTNGLITQISSDGITWRDGDEYTLPANKEKTYAFQPNKKYWRIKYINGGTNQTVFDLQTVFKKTSALPSSHRIQDDIVDEDDAQLIKAVLTGEDEVSGIFQNVQTREQALNVNSAWVYRKIVNETFHQHTDTNTTPSIAIVAGDTTITVVDISGCAVGDEIKLEEGSIQEIGLLTVTECDTGSSIIKLDRPIANDYTTAALVQEVISNMAVNGSLGSPQIFEVDPPSGVVWQITRILIEISDNTSADNSKFGGGLARTNGISLRATTSAGRTVVFANWKRNGDMKLDMYDVEYTDKAGGGNHSVEGRWTFTKAEVVAELDGDADPVQTIELLVQDNNTDLISMYIRAQGRVFTP